MQSRDIVVTTFCRLEKRAKSIMRNISIALDGLGFACISELKEDEKGKDILVKYGSDIMELVEKLYLGNPTSNISYANMKIYKKWKHRRIVLCVCPKNVGVFYHAFSTLSSAKRFYKTNYQPNGEIPKWSNGD